MYRLANYPLKISKLDQNGDCWAWAKLSNDTLLINVGQSIKMLSHFPQTSDWFCAGGSQLRSKENHFWVITENWTVATQKVASGAMNGAILKFQITSPVFCSVIEPTSPDSLKISRGSHLSTPAWTREKHSNCHQWKRYIENSNRKKNNPQKTETTMPKYIRTSLLWQPWVRLS
jgi:hypothetical protein